MPTRPDYAAKPLPYAKLPGISEQTLSVHHGKLYLGYVKKLNEIREKLTALSQDETALSAANATFSDLRSLRDAETFAANAVYLHEAYFNSLGGDGRPGGALLKAIEDKWGSFAAFQKFFLASAMAVRGWVILAWDANLNRLKIYGCDAHNQGGIWNCTPLLVLDVYEHAYFMDYGADRVAYLQAFWANVNWAYADDQFAKINRATAS